MWLTRMTPPLFRELNRLERELQTVDRSLNRLSRSELPLEMLNWRYDDEHVVVRAALPGVAASDLEIGVEGRLLTVQGERRPVELPENAVWLRRERPVGRFAQTMRLPYDVAADQVTAELVDGLLTITLPRREADKPRKIAVQTRTME